VHDQHPLRPPNALLPRPRAPTATEKQKQEAQPSTTETATQETEPATTEMEKPTPPIPPKVSRSLNDDCDEVVRQFLRDEKWGQEPAEPGQLWLLSKSEVKKLWRKSNELADKCPVQDESTSFSTRQKTIRRGFKRVTGS
jgi:hypothetical protein